MCVCVLFYPTIYKFLMFLAITVTCPFHNINLFIIFIIISMMYSLLSSLLQYNNKLYFSFLLKASDSSIVSSEDKSSQSIYIMIMVYLIPIRLGYILKTTKEFIVYNVM